MSTLTCEEMELLKKLGMSEQDVKRKLNKLKSPSKQPKVAQVHEYNLIRIEHCNLCKTVHNRYYWMRKDFGIGQIAPYLYAKEVSEQIIQDNGLKTKTENVKYPTCSHCSTALVEWEKVDLIKELLRRRNC